MATISAREFNQDVSAAKRAADQGPLIVTDRGRPSYVLLSYDDYVDRVRPRESLYDALRMDDGDDIELEIEPRGTDERTVDL